jgi:4-amino-4-deoxy-L-arabinose transferase-like glycosyltransferase
MKRVSALIKNPSFILLSAFALRIAYFFVLSILNATPSEDGPEYDQIALNLVKYHQFAIYPGAPTSFRPPLYPFFLAIIYTVFGHSYAVVRIAQAIFSSLSTYLLYRIAYILTEDKRVAVISAWLLALYPPSLYFSGRFLTETLFIFLVLLSFLLLLKTKNTWSGLSSGMFLGLSALTRTQGLLFLPLFLLWGYLKGKLKFTFSILFGTILAILPWTIRNYRIHHAFIPICTNGGITFWMSNNPYALEDRFIDWVLENKKNLITLPSNLVMWKNLSEVESDRNFYRMGIRWILKHPGDFIKLIPKKLIRAWSPLTTSGVPLAKRFRILYGVIYTILILLAFWGFFVTRTQWRKLWPLYYPPVAFTLLFVIFYGSTRQRSPADPFWLILTAVGIVRLLEIFGTVEREGQQSL